MARMRGVPLWVWWIVLVWAISVPWIGVTSEPQWARVHAIPFTDPADRPRDMLANTALFVPFGYSFARGRRWWTAVLAAALVSVGAEATQLFGTLRYPSATDVTAAMVGAAAGALWRLHAPSAGAVVQRQAIGSADDGASGRVHYARGACRVLHPRKPGDQSGPDGGVEG